LSLAYSQTPSKPTDQSLLNQAYQKFKIGDFYDAIPDFESLLRENPEDVDIQFKYSICLVEAGKNPQRAIPYLKTSYKSGNVQAAFYLAKVYYGYMQLDSAHFYLVSYQKLKTDKDLKILEAEKMINQLFDAMLLMNQPSGVAIQNMGKSINSIYADYSPIISADNSILYFTSKREDSKGEKRDDNGQYYEDIYASRMEDSVFLQAENVGSPLNTKEHDATVAISADGNTIIIYRTDPYSGSGDLFFSRKDGFSWSNPIKMGLNINSLYQETSASLSADGNTLYFASNRPGGNGGFDIYKSTKSKNGVWAIAVNLGGKINTKYDEESPCIGADGKILYFSSKGHEPNMGGFDVYKSELDKYGKWQNPVNLGFPINTLHDDLYFIITANAKIGYISSNRIDSEGEVDIYQFYLNEKEPAITLFTGVVRDINGNIPIKADIELWDRDTNKTIYKTYSNALTGTFLVVIPNEKNVKLIFEKGNTIYTEITDANADGKFNEIYKVIELEEK